MNEDQEFNIVDSNGDVKWGPFSDELAAHNKLQQLINNAIDDECDGLKIV